jgi:hypothetical protein
LAFPDYSDEYPHEPWTIGYTGRPGGPDWYINKVNNTLGHGPGGQSQYALEEQGDSCFGRVVEGQDVLTKQLFAGEVWDDQSEYQFFLKEPAEIIGAVVLTKNAPDMVIHMGTTPLHREDFVNDDDDEEENDDGTTTRKSGADSSSAENFGSMLKNALQNPAMDPAESDADAKVKDTSTAEDKPVVNKETKEGSATSEEKRNNNKRPEKKVTRGDKETNQKIKEAVKRMPRIPKIQRATEA